MNVYLIGYRCTGKTTVGKTLAAELNWPLADTDAALVAMCGMSIADWVRKHGWAAFRCKERIVMSGLCRRDRHVVATGGGVVLDPANVRDMQASGILIWLRARAETIRQRMLADARTGEQRPALTAKGMLDEIDALLSERASHYEKAMHFFVDTDGSEVRDVCRTILDKLAAFGIRP